ncbi:MAG TPA: choice-of-anchor tandem repeat GloVer-containing protein [Verrucomicrobiae bacterium]|nr:choice-of-anchor tandem repeat GloVer-containing protein [Verrucomicrobiae bacterium]
MIRIHLNKPDLGVWCGMKRIGMVFHVAILGVWAFLCVCNNGCAQSVRFDVLYSFTNNPESPYGTLIQGPDKNFYGTTVSGGWGYGTIFGVTTNGSITTLYSFTGGVNGENPQAGLVQGTDGNFYGTTQGGGSNNFGTVFKWSTNGSLTTLYSFTGGSGGAYPYAALTLGSDGTLYGTTYGGGNSSSAGSVFKVTTNGFVTNLYAFSGGVIGISPDPPDEGYPTSALTLGPDGNFYGTTTGSSFTVETENSGTIYEITSNGVMTTLYWFSSQFDPGGDGSVPIAGLSLGPDGNFYGTTDAGSTNGFGTVFKVTTKGVLTTLVAFNATNGGASRGKLTLGNDNNFYGTSGSGGNGYGTIFQVTTNGRLRDLHFFAGVDGAYPVAGLTPDGSGNFFGTTSGGGSNVCGTFFEVAGNVVFTAISSFTGGAHGANPQAGLIQGPDGDFYGTTGSGGTNNSGTVFKVTTNGALTTMVSFNGLNGANPYGDLAFGNDGEIYGTAYNGGVNQQGVLFRVSTNGMLTPLVPFGNAGTGWNPYAGLTLGTDGNFYGTTEEGGPGTAFELATNDVLTTIHFFGYSGVNVDGALPDGKLALGPDGAFYGTTFWGGAYWNFGTVFRMLTNGTVASLYSFTGGADGANPRAGLTWGYNGNLYGTTEGGGGNASGVVFTVTTNGSFTTLHSFTGGSDGSTPYAGLTLGGDGNLYGSASGGGGGNYGTLFQITTNGTFRTLVSFNGTNGANPKGALTLGSDGNFYGTTVSGGSGDGGVIFRLVVGGTINITLSNGTPSITVSGQTGNRYALDYTDSLVPSNNWVSITTNTISSNSQSYLDTSALGISNRFYRLRLVP